MSIRTIPKIAVTLTAIATALAAMTGSAASAATAACASPSWTLVRTPTPPGSTSVVEFPFPGESDTIYAPAGRLGLESASMLSAGNAMLVGGQGSEQVGAPAWGALEQPWILHLANGSVTQTAGPTQGPVGFEATGGSFDSSTDGWLLGQADAPWLSSTILDLMDNKQLPQVSEQWDGSHWTMTPVAVSPHPNTEMFDLASIAAVSPDDAWAVGGTYTPFFGQWELPNKSTGALIEHWDGSSWNVVPNPASTLHGTALTSISVVSPDDIWAVGSPVSNPDKDFAPLVEHFDGTQWSVLPTPPTSAGDRFAQLNAVSIDGSGNVWVAGYQLPRYSSTVQNESPLVDEWNGSTWSPAQLPALPAGESTAAIYAASPSDVWASTDADNSATGTAVFLNWNGRTWTPIAVPGPKENGLHDEYPAITGTGPTDVWAAGYVDSYATSSFTPQIAHLSCS